MKIYKLPTLFSSLVLALGSSIGTAATTTLVIDLGAGTVIQGGTFGTHGATNLPLPALPAGSILRSIEVNTVLQASDNDNYASDLSVLLDPTPESPGGDFLVEITEGLNPFGAPSTVALGWPFASQDFAITPLVDTKTDADWAAAGPIDLSTTGLFLGNAYKQPGWVSPEGGTWSGTITLTYDVTYALWSGGAAADADTNGDGVLNAVAYALGAVDVDEDATDLLPTFDNNTDPDFFIFSFNLSDYANDDPSTTIKVEYGSDLSGWTTAVHDGTNVIIAETGSDPTNVEVKLRRSALAPTGKLFALLRVVVTP